VGARARSPRLGASAAALALVLALALASGAAASLPREGVFVPGQTLGGVRVGMSKAAVKRLWGNRFGRCRSCPAETWYFTYQPFQPQGAGVTFRRNRVTAVFTLWQPPGWRTTGGLELGDSEAAITRTYGVLIRRRCIRYTALLLRDGRAQTAFYVFDGRVWGFGLTQPGANPCR
jgi:hypothetical protein